MRDLQFSLNQTHRVRLEAALHELQSPAPLPPSRILSRFMSLIIDLLVSFLKIAPKRWRLEIDFGQDAVLMLSSINLPDGIQRRRTAVDEHNMRAIFEEHDVVCAEVRGFQHGGSLHLQARSQKYGKVHARSSTL
ncbi:hypothetical protein PR202_ga12843 [Eleusine coracana subsp. coracana]|uniref:RRP4 S1 domain-containing protein n=1 Tax=Eleusine coracana subsp. coracana TaxID=191504 RepID=A0AAV5CD83_ELECO|nr:hypothetical protein PR202_ga12843 [Eleusine coracana subsp. coracana]